MVGTKFYKLPGVFNRQTIMDYFYIFFKGFVFARPTFGYIGWLNDGEGNPHLLQFNVYPIRVKKKVKELLVIIKDLIRIDMNEKKPFEEKLQVDDEYKIKIPDSILETKLGDVMNFKLTDDGKIIIEKEDFENGHFLNSKSTQVFLSRFNIR